MSITVREYLRLLCQKLTFIETRRTKHTFFELRSEGLPTVRTMASHNRKQDIGRRLEHDLAQELQVPTTSYREMCSCTKSRQDYCDWLRERQAGDAGGA